jgi:hypothetical protein
MISNFEEIKTKNTQERYEQKKATRALFCFQFIVCRGGRAGVERGLQRLNINMLSKHLLIEGGRLTARTVAIYEEQKMKE